MARGIEEFFSLLVFPHPWSNNLLLNKLLWLVMTGDVVYRGWLALSRMGSSLLSVLISATVASFIPTTDPAHLISLSSEVESYLVVLPPPAHHNVEEDAGDRIFLQMFKEVSKEVYLSYCFD